MTIKKANNAEKRSHPLPWIAAIFFVLTAAVLGGLYWDRTRSVDEIRFTGYGYVELNRLQKQINIPTGVSPDSLNYDVIRDQIEKIPFVKRARIKMNPGGTMIINITERDPIALLINGSHSSFVDAEGIKLSVKPGSLSMLPILYGFDVQPLSDTLNSDAFEKVSAFLVQLQNQLVANATISEVAWSDENGIVALTNNSGIKLIFGKEHYQRRLRNWEAFYAQVIPHKGVDKMQSVNLSFKKQIVTHEN